MKTSTILVTGGAGFIGSNIVADLCADGRYRVAVCDWMGTGEKWRNLAKHEVDDVIFPEQMFDYLKQNGTRLEAIVHMGAISSTTEKDANLIVRNNFQLSRDLWDWCAGAGVRLIYASSAATYGDGKQGFADRSDADYLTTLLPLNAYAWSKHLFDRRVAHLVTSGGPTPPQWGGLKFFNVYGPNEHHKSDMRSVACQMYDQLRERDHVRLFRSHHPDYDDGGQLRDFVYVKDCGAVVLWLLENPGVSGLFNLGTGQARSFLDLANAVFAALDKTPNIEFIDTPEHLRPKYQYFTQAEMTKLREAGFSRQFTPLEAGVTDYVKTYLCAGDPYR